MQGINTLQPLLALGISHFVLSLFCRNGCVSSLYKCPTSCECFYLNPAYKVFPFAFCFTAANFPTICVHNSRRQRSLWRCYRKSRNLHGLGYFKYWPLWIPEDSRDALDSLLPGLHDPVRLRKISQHVIAVKAMSHQINTWRLEITTYYYYYLFLDSDRQLCITKSASE